MITRKIAHLESSKALSFLPCFWAFLVFCLEGLPYFLNVFPSFPRILGLRLEEKFLFICFFSRWFSWLITEKKQGEEDQGWSLVSAKTKENQNTKERKISVVAWVPQKCIRGRASGATVRSGPMLKGFFIRLYIETRHFDTHPNRFGYVLNMYPPALRLEAVPEGYPLRPSPRYPLYDYFWCANAWAFLCQIFSRENQKN